MPERRAATIHAVLAKTPEWIRGEFASKEPTARARAEEALAAMLEAAIRTEAEVTEAEG